MEVPPQLQQAEQTEQPAETPVSTVAQEQSTLQEADAWRRLNIKNRADVDLALEKICIYFETLEPSHPAPVIYPQGTAANEYELLRHHERYQS